MIKWEEFEHIHVVRKIREVVGNWFHVDVVLADDQGRVRNFEKGQKKTWSNPLLAHVLNKDSGFDYLAQIVEKVNSHLSHNDLRHHEFDLMPGIHGIAFPIVLEGEYLGAVLALGYKKQDSVKAAPPFFAQMESFGFSKVEAEKAFDAVKSIPNSEMQYFKDLSDLVAQEIVTLHKEIVTRENRIQELNNQLGDRHSYNSMIGKSKPMQDMYSLLDKIRGTESTVLIQGENGTGKELIAKSHSL